jgi:hypothetical protein
MTRGYAEIAATPLGGTPSQAGKRWTDTGRYHDERGLKNRPPGETRVVPLPPHLVALTHDKAQRVDPLPGVPGAD